MRIFSAPFHLALALCGLTSSAWADELNIRVDDPKFIVLVPGQSQVTMGPHPGSAQNPAARLMGSSADGFNVSVLLPKAAGATAQQCATWLVGSTLSRFAPDLSAIRLTPAGTNAWLLVYPLKFGEIEQLKAHVFSGNNKGQCLEVHMSRLKPTEQQREAWFSGFKEIVVKSE